MSSVARTLSSTSYPAIFCVASDTTDFTVRAFEDVAEGSKITVLSNLKAPKSFINGQELAVKKISGEEVETSSSVDDIADMFPVVASCQSCQHDTLVAKDVAVDIDGEEVACMNCGDLMEVSYYGDFAEEDDLSDDTDDDNDSDDDEPEEEDTEDKGEEEQTPEDIVDNLTDEPEEPSEDDAEDETSMSDEDEGDKAEDDAEDTPDEGEDDAEDEAEEGPEPDDMMSDDEEDVDAEDDDDEDDDDEGDPSEEVSVVVASAAMSDPDSELRLVACDSNLDRVEVFKGPSHIGCILRADAESSVQPLFTKPQNLHMAFAADLAKEWGNFLSSSVLDSYGFKAATVEFTQSEVADQAVEEVRQEMKEEMDAQIKEAEEAFVTTLSIAMAGINKGVLKGPNFGQEIADTLSRYGVVKADVVAQRVVDKVTEPFLRSALEHASNLREEGVDYTRGLSATIEAASFQITPKETDPSEITSAAAPIPSPNDTALPNKVEAASLNPKSPNRYRNAFARLGRK